MRKSKIYLNEALHQIRYAEICFSAYRQARESHDIPKVFFHVHHFVMHAANVDKILVPKPDSPRVALLQGSIEFQGIDLKTFRRLRNHLEHFDERLDRWVSIYDGQPFFDANLVDGALGFPDKAFLRAMDGDTFKFQGESYDLSALLAQLIEIGRRIESSPHYE